MKYWARTDAGCLKTDNQDALAAFPERGLFLVCDGMGGMAAGGTASALAVETLPGLLQSPPDLRPALQEVSLRIANLAQRSRGMFGMGSTVVVAWFYQDSLWLAHAGDSRAYLGSRRLTRDHNFGEDLGLSAEDALQVRGADRHTRYLGLRELEPEIQQLADVRGRLLLCTDGITKELGDAEIAALLEGDDPARGLVDAARQRGGRDNLTALVVEVPGSPWHASPRRIGSSW